MCDPVCDVLVISPKYVEVSGFLCKEARLRLDLQRDEFACWALFLNDFYMRIDPVVMRCLLTKGNYSRLLRSKEW